MVRDMFVGAMPMTAQNSDLECLARPVQLPHYRATPTRRTQWRPCKHDVGMAALGILCVVAVSSSYFGGVIGHEGLPFLLSRAFQLKCVAGRKLGKLRRKERFGDGADSHRQNCQGFRGRKGDHSDRLRSSKEEEEHAEVAFTQTQSASPICRLSRTSRLLMG